MEYPTVEQAAKLLRRHGVNAYEQEGDLMLYIVGDIGWEVVTGFRDLEDYTSVHIARMATVWISNNLDSHTHEED